MQTGRQTWDGSNARRDDVYVSVYFTEGPTASVNIDDSGRFVALATRFLRTTDEIVVLDECELHRVRPRGCPERPLFGGLDGNHLTWQVNLRPARELSDPYIAGPVLVAIEDGQIVARTFGRLDRTQGWITSVDAPIRWSVPLQGVGIALARDRVVEWDQDKGTLTVHRIEDGASARTITAGPACDERSACYAVETARDALVLVHRSKDDAGDGFLALVDVTDGRTVWKAAVPDQGIRRPTSVRTSRRTIRPASIENRTEPGTGSG